VPLEHGVPLLPLRRSCLIEVEKRILIRFRPLAPPPPLPDGDPVDPFQNFARMSGFSELMALLQAQTEALAQLPRTIADLQGTVRTLTEATTAARETIASAQRTGERLETLVKELEEPVRALRPGLDRVGRVLNDPVVDTIPDTLLRIRDDLVPLVAGMRHAQVRMNSLAGIFRRKGTG
jgi:hypothetical protein